jgi:hypothetical protein
MIPILGVLGLLLLTLCLILVSYWHFTSKYWKEKYDTQFRKSLDQNNIIGKFKEEKKKLISVLENTLEELY